MNDGTKDRVSVSFPASPDFARIGRVAVAGLALRLGVDVADVEKLRLAVDRSVEALRGPGRIRLDACWEPQRLSISVDNPDRQLDDEGRREVSEELATMVDEVSVGDSRIRLLIGAGDTER
ncbi:MAG: hypothetical protein AAGD35_13665 [Actinomycetota bacterium]